jgi:ketosteroid isomerase-like protein
MHEGELRVAFLFRIADGRITEIDLVADRAAIAQSVIEH